MKFKGQVSFMWIILVVLLNASLIGMVIVNGGLKGASFVFLFVLVVMDFMICPPLFITEVEIDKKIMIIRYGFSTYKFLIDDFTSVTRTDKFFGTYALGSDKILLKRKNQGEVVVSLKDNKSFINELKKINRKMKIFV